MVISVRGIFSVLFPVMPLASASRRPMRGFTLIELLTVIAIMGLLIGLVAVAARPDAQQMLRVEAERLAQLAELAAAEASLTGNAILWTANDAGYRFSRRRGDSGWTEIRDNDLLRERALPAGVIISGLSVENVRQEGAALRLEFTPYAPPLIFRIELSSGTERYFVGPAHGIVRAVAGETHGAPTL